MPHPDVALERARLEFAQDMPRRDAAPDREQVANEDMLAANEADAEAVKWQLQRRLASLDDDAAVLCFGRIDETAGERWYIGRRHIEDGDGGPVVVDWRAEVATPFYRATLADPFGLDRRRRFVFTGRDLTDVFEEDFDDPDSLVGSGGVPDPLLAELGRARTGQMRDIVATIQAEQDAIIRAPLETLPRRAGRPGHRQDRGRSAPRRVPALRAPRAVSRAKACSSSVRTRCSCATSRRCCRRSARRRRRRRRSTGCSRCASASSPTTRSAVAAIKGDARMAEVIARAAADAIRIPDDGVTGCASAPAGCAFPAAELDALVDDARRRDARRSRPQRERFRQALVRRAYDRYTGGVALELDETDFGTELLADARVAQGDRRLLAERERGRARARAADAAGLPRARGGRRARRRRAERAAATARRGRSVDAARPAAARRSRGAREGRAAPVRARRRRRGAGSLADAVADARAPGTPSTR